MRKLSIVILFVSVIGVSISFGADPVGSIIALEGKASAVGQDKQQRALAIKSAIYLNDRIITAEGSKLQISFKDDSVISQGEKSEMVVDEYVFSPDNKEDNSCSVKMMKGMFRVITGKITKLNPERFRVRTKMATIGIRGCDVGFVVTEVSANVYVISLKGQESITVVARDKVGGGEWDGLLSGKWDDPDVAKQQLINVTKENRIVSVTQGAGAPTERPLTSTELAKLINAVTPDQTTDAGSGAVPGTTEGTTTGTGEAGTGTTDPAAGTGTTDPATGIESGTGLGDLSGGLSGSTGGGTGGTTPNSAVDQVVAANQQVVTTDSITGGTSSTIPPADTTTTTTTTTGGGSTPTTTQPPPASTPSVFTELGAGADWSWGKWESGGMIESVSVSGNILAAGDYAAIAAGTTAYNLSGVGSAAAVISQGGTKSFVQGSCNLAVTVGGGAFPNWNGVFSLVGGANNLNFATYGVIDSAGKLKVDPLNNLQAFSMQVNGISFGSPHVSGWNLNGSLLGPPGAIKPTGAIGNYNFNTLNGPNSATANGIFGTDLN